MFERILDKLFWPLIRHKRMISVSAVLGAASATTAAAAFLETPYDRLVPLGVGGLALGLYYLATQSWERHRKAQEQHQDAVIREAVQEYTDRYRKPGTGPYRKDG